MTALLKERSSLDIVMGRRDRPLHPPESDTWDHIHDIAHSQILLSVTDDVLKGYDQPSEELNPASHLWNYIEDVFTSGPQRPEGKWLLSTKITPWSQLAQAGLPPTWENNTPVFFGSVILPDRIVPCKVTNNEGAFWQSGGRECKVNNNPFTVLIYDPACMELVQTSRGAIPRGRRPIIGGYEADGSRLYHAVGIHNGIRVPGKVGQRTANCYFGLWGEHVVEEHELICWKS